MLQFIGPMWEKEPGWIKKKLDDGYRVMGESLGWWPAGANVMLVRRAKGQFVLAVQAKGIVTVHTETTIPNVREYMLWRLVNDKRAEEVRFKTQMARLTNYERIIANG